MSVVLNSLRKAACWFSPPSGYVTGEYVLFISLWGGGGDNGSQRHFFYTPHLYSAVKQGLDAVLRVGNSGRMISVLLVHYIHLCIHLYGDKCQM